MSQILRAEGGQLDESSPADAGFANLVESPLQPSTTTSTNDFRPPCLHKITTTFPSGAKSILALYATPTRPGFCRHIGANILIRGEDFKVPPGLGFYTLPLPAWLLHVLGSLFLHQDMVFLHHQERMLRASSSYAFGVFPGRWG